MSSGRPIHTPRHRVRGRPSMWNSMCPPYLFALRVAAGLRCSARSPWKDAPPRGEESRSCRCRPCATLREPEMPSNSPAAMLKAWAESRFAPGAAGSPAFNVDIGGSHKDSSYLSLDGQRVMGRVTLWSGGEADLEAVDLTSGDQLLWFHEKKLDQRALESWLEQLRRLESSPPARVVFGATASIVKSYVAGNAVSHNQLPALIQGVYSALAFGPGQAVASSPIVVKASQTARPRSKRERTAARRAA